MQFTSTPGREINSAPISVCMHEPFEDGEEAVSKGCSSATSGDMQRSSSLDNAQSGNFSRQMKHVLCMRCCDSSPLLLSLMGHSHSISCSKMHRTEIGRRKTMRLLIVASVMVGWAMMLQPFLSLSSLCDSAPIAKLEKA